MKKSLLLLFTMDGTTRQLDTIGFYPEDMDGYSFVLTVENEKSVK